MQQAPFVMRKDTNKTSGNDNFYGYCIDLLEEIWNHSTPQFTYTLREVADGQFGSKDPNTKKWSGLIGELADGVNAKSLIGIFLEK